MTVKEFKEFLNRIPEDADVVFEQEIRERLDSETCRYEYIGKDLNYDLVYNQLILFKK